MSSISGFEKRSNLRFVKIYFATPTYDKITKDEKASFGTRLSSIGGTMGLLNGFSIISLVEILYFILCLVIVSIKKFLYSFLYKERKQ